MKKNAKPERKVKVSERRKELACIAMYKAVGKYVGLHGGCVFFADGVQTIEWPDSKPLSFTVGIKCFGKKPDSAGGTQ
jgi:hypothetical protein